MRAGDKRTRIGRTVGPFTDFTEKRVELPRGSTKRLHKSAQLTPAQFMLLQSRLRICERVAVALAGWLGPRRSEAFGLKWKDLDLKSRVVSFRRGLVQGRITPLKTEASRTDLSLPEDVVRLLLEWYAVTPYDGREDWVFASPQADGKLPLWPDQMLKKWIQPTAKSLGLPNIGWHSFRHSLSAWAKEIFKLDDVRTLLRHDTLQMTSQYGELQLAKKQALQKQLEMHIKESAKAEGRKERGRPRSLDLGLTLRSSRTDKNNSGQVA